MAVSSSSSVPVSTFAPLPVNIAWGY
jgi:hypothetical protein